MRVLLADLLFFHFDEGSQGALEFGAFLVGLLLGVLFVFDGWKRPLGGPGGTGPVLRQLYALG